MTLVYYSRKLFDSDSSEFTEWRACNNINGLDISYFHREDGPAIERIMNKIGLFLFNRKIGSNDLTGNYSAFLMKKGWLPMNVDTRDQWWIEGKEITDDVNQWIYDNNIPHWSKWDEEIKSLFVLTFS